ncbi:MAG: hypothetical protein WB443_00115 [Nitrososphaeraceae archaeon]|jgi:hypothetical protein
MIYDLHKKTKNNWLMTTTPTLCSFFVFIVTFSAVTVSMAQAQTAIPIPKHTYAYMTGAKNGLAAAIVDQYNVGAACASFTGSDLDHCIAEYYGAVAGYQYDVFSFRSSAFNLSSFSG